jgi:hypothetical protein
MVSDLANCLIERHITGVDDLPNALAMRNNQDSQSQWSMQKMWI